MIAKQPEPLLARSAEMEPQSEEAWMWLASISDYPEELLAFLHNVLQINPYNERALEWHRATESLLAKTLVQRGSDAQAQGSTDLARQCFEQALDHDEACETAWFGLAGIASSNEEKTKCFQRVVAINPGNADARQALEAVKTTALQLTLNSAKKAAMAGEHKEALAMIDEVLSERPSDVDTWILRSHLASDLSEKLVSLARALDIDPENAMARSSYEFLSTSMSSSDHLPEEPSEPVQEHVSDPVYEEATPAGFEQASDPVYEEATPAEFEQASDAVYEEATPAEFEQASDPVYEEATPAEFEQASDPVYEVAAPAEFEQVSEPVYEEATPAAFKDDREYTEEPAEESCEPNDDMCADNEGSEMSFQTVTDEYNFDTVDDEQPYNETAVVEVKNPVESLLFVEEAEETALPVFDEPDNATEQFACPYCMAAYENKGFECGSCHAVLTLSDIEALLANPKADVDVIQGAVTAMEAEWNLREFNENELTVLAIGHFNLRNLDRGFKYLQEASRLDPNNVILVGQTNAIAIRLEEMRRQEETPDTSPKGKSILVVDDSATVRKLIAGKLEKSGHNVVCAVDGVEGLARLAEALPDLVLLDIGMPRMDGYEVCREIRANPAAKDLPVVMISGKDGFFDKVRGRMAGATGYVTKPFGPETLMKALETYLAPEPGGTRFQIQ